MNKILIMILLFIERSKMKKGKLIIIEGTDCSGKQTQSDLLVERLNQEGITTFKYAFPAYDTPTGKIVGGPYLGKKMICDGWFLEGASNVDPLVSSAYFTADRRYNKDIILKHLNKGENVILDRYVESNMAHQGGKLANKKDREEMYQKLDLLEFEIMELPRPDLVIFLYMPYKYAEILKKGREEGSDQHESSPHHLQNAEEAYLELTKKYHFKQVNCILDDHVRQIEDINNELLNILKKEINNEYK